MAEKSKYPIINKQLRGFDEKEEIYLWDSEIDDLIGAVQMQLAYDSNYGIRKERADGEKYGEREKAFQQQWLKENHPSAGYGYYGIIQALFEDKPINSPFKQTIISVNNRDRRIVATIIQWLGSNIGFNFLENSLKNCGYIIQSKNVYDEQMEEVKKAREIIKKAKEMIK